jgi:hypothetical protein
MRNQGITLQSKHETNHQKVDDGAESSEICSDWKSIVGALDFLCDPKQGIAVALFLVRYYLVGGATAAVALASE